MRRITRHSCNDAPVLEEQETEGQRQLHSLLLQQLDTGADIDRCVAKRKCFAPATLYKPFGEQAAGVRSLSQFQTLQDGEQEMSSLRELGLTDAEIELWRSREKSEAGEKGRGVSAAPSARHQRLQAIQDKMKARVELLSRPQRLSASRALSRREMEIERSLFQGSERLSFLSALYHQEEDSQSGQDGTSSSDPLDSLYRDVLGQKEPGATGVFKDVPSSDPEGCLNSQTLPLNQPDQLREADQSRAQSDVDTSQLDGRRDDSDQSENAQEASVHSRLQGGGVRDRLAWQKRLSLSQPIGSLCTPVGRGSEGTMKLTGPVEEVSEEEIRKNRATEDEIRSIPRFQSYQQGAPSKVLCVKNLSSRASLAQLISLFSRFQRPGAPPLLYRLLTGRMKGQAFITLPGAEIAGKALELLNGYRLLERPLVIEFGRERKTE
ncbi:RNA-binding protein 41 isoform X1 [Paramormyrops kingsleyae]|uniref:RNA-binding protein 41 isoform X1 n=2 Tax=Paramormyrops kingsleyae TaxID=1676925 RepID=UPI003B979E31